MKTRRPNHGWVIGYKRHECTNAVGVYNTTPNGGFGAFGREAALGGR